MSKPDQMTTENDRPIMDYRRRIALCTAGLLMFWLGQGLQRRYAIWAEPSYPGWLGLGLSLMGAYLICFYGGRGILPGRYRLHSRKLALVVFVFFAIALIWFWVRP